MKLSTALWAVPQLVLRSTRERGREPICRGAWCGLSRRSVEECVEKIRDGFRSLPVTARLRSTFFKGGESSFEGIVERITGGFRSLPVTARLRSTFFKGRESSVVGHVERIRDGFRFLPVTARLRSTFFKGGESSVEGIVERITGGFRSLPVTARLRSRFFKGRESSVVGHVERITGGFRSLAAGLAALMIFCVPAMADQGEQPVGLVLSAGGGKLVRLNTETPLQARAGDLLFTGDSLRTESTPASFLFCPASSLETLGPSGEVRFEAKAPKVKTGKLSPAPAKSCVLPTVLRVAVASQQHYGVTMTRGGPDAAAVPPVPRDKLPPDVTAALAPLDAALAADPKDQAALVGEATVFENHNLPVNALDTYLKLRDQWPDAVWVKGKIFDLQQAIATSAASASASAASAGNTYALLIGVSKFKDPGLSLQFADADPADFSKLVESPRTGGFPPDN